jgi:glycosyltransferase involved in cell wall biosynthesis
MASTPSRPLVVHNSNPHLGGAETSLLAAVAETGLKPLFLVPAEGGLSRAIAARGWEWRVLAWPKGLAGLTQNRWYALPFLLPWMVPYLFRLSREFRGAGLVWSSGVKSHAACLALSPWLGSRLLFDVRDFLRPPALRKAIAAAARRFGCGVSANSRAVAADFPSAAIEYPRVGLARPPLPRREPGGRRIVSHLAYFAPYKGQDLFLACARKLLDAGVDAEFWIIGDVIYPAAAYARYRERIYETAARLRLTNHVRFLGKVEGGEEVQALLERTHLLLHCTREPEPFGRAVMEALLSGCEAVCHKGSGVVEVTDSAGGFPEWMRPLQEVLGPDYVRVTLPGPSR